MLVSKMAKRHVTVCLSGDGGMNYLWVMVFINGPIGLITPFWGHSVYPFQMLDKSSRNKYKRAAKVFSPIKNWKSHIFSQEQNLFSEKEIKELLLKNHDNKIIDNLNSTKELNRKFSPTEQQAFFDLNYYLIDDLLVKVDRSSMYSSLEARVPLLDHNIIEFALNLEQKFKINNGIQKYILKD